MHPSILGRASFAAIALVSLAAPASATGPDSPEACALARDATIGAELSVPFRVVNGRIYVTARVDDKGPFVFAVDTGASGMGRADVSLVTILGIPATGSGHTSDGVTTAEVKTVRLRSIDLGGFVRHDLEVPTRDYNSKQAPEAAFSGILGREFFGDGLMVIDYPARRLTFTRAVALTGDGNSVLPYERAFRVPVIIGETLTEGNLDTGANVSFVLPKSLFERVGGGAIEAAGEGKLTNTVVSTGKTMMPGPFRIGAATLSNVEVRVSDRYPELLVGAHALRHFVMLIDQRSKRIALCRPDNAGSPKITSTLPASDRRS
ncbi:retropepsin-like aspartic protease [Sphingobium ummariense]